MKDRMTRYFPITVVLLFLAMSCNSQSGVKELIIGDWVAIKEATVSGRDTIFNGVKIIVNEHYEFTGDQFIDRTPRPIMPPPINYTIAGNFIVYGGRRMFNIEKVTKDELILTEYEPGYPDPFRYVFKKVTR